jgi:HAMP domain-containing protein
MKISKIKTHNLRNDAHFQFHTEFKDLVVKFNPETLKVKPAFDKYLPLWEREDEALKKINKSSLTEKIQEADRLRDEIFAGMVEINKGMCRHFNKQTAEAAGRIKIVLDTYGNVAKKPLNEETSAIYNLLQDLRSNKYSADATASGITAWADELERLNQAFDQFMKERFDETAAKCDIVLKAARAELDNAYRIITERVDALIIVEGTETYEQFVKTLNAVIAKYNVKRGRSRNGGAEEEQEEGEENNA